MISIGQPNYGLAMKTGILAARGDFVILRRDRSVRHRVLRAGAGFCWNGPTPIWWSAPRPWWGRTTSAPGCGAWAPACTTACCAGLQLPWHRHARAQGLQARGPVGTAERCVLDRDVFASEFVIRAHRREEEGGGDSRSPCMRSDHPRSSSQTGTPRNPERGQLAVRAQDGSGSAVRLHAQTLPRSCPAAAYAPSLAAVQKEKSARCRRRYTVRRATFRNCPELRGTRCSPQEENNGRV